MIGARVLNEFRIPVFLLVLSLVLSAVEAVGADWKYLGGAALPNGRRTIVFFDSESVEYRWNESIKVWTVSFNLSDIVSVRKSHEKEVMERTASKRKMRYCPPFASVHPETAADDHVHIISFEETVNAFKAKARARVLFEIRCADTMIRTVSIVSYKYIGEIESRRKNDTAGSWGLIRPGSNADTLRKIVCGQERAHGVGENGQGGWQDFPCPQHESEPGMRN